MHVGETAVDAVVPKRQPGVFEIEGEHLDKDLVRSSIARRLGIDIGALAPADRNVEGIVDVMLTFLESPVSSR